VPNYLDDFYIFRISWNCFELAQTFLFHRHRRDYSEFLLHHIVTLMLIFISYLLNYHTIGANCLIVCDFTDIPVKILKFTYDIASAPVSFCIWCWTVFIWSYLRIYFFYNWIVLPMYVDPDLHSLNNPV
jgi:hypothetical protein